MKKRIIVRGPALSRSGYGEHARFTLRALRRHEDKLDIFLENTNWGQTGWIFDDNEERRWIDSIITKTAIYAQQENPQFDVSAQVTIPNEWVKMAPINIGVTAGIETTRVAPQWVEKSYVMDKIITISNHSKNVYENTSYHAENNQTGNVIDDFRCQTPIEVVHYPVRSIEPAKIKLDLENDFNFLAIAQVSPRKNINNTITWFVEEFIDQPVGLVLKVFVKNNSIIDRKYTKDYIKNLLSKYPQRKCKVHLLHGDMLSLIHISEPTRPY